MPTSKVASSTVITGKERSVVRELEGIRKEAAI